VVGLVSDDNDDDDNNNNNGMNVLYMYVSVKVSG